METEAEPLQSAHYPYKTLQNTLCFESMYNMTYGGGGGEESRRLCLGFGLPLGNDEFLCARNWIEDRRGPSCESDPPRVGSSSGLATWRGAGDTLREARVLGDVLMLAGR
mgnify:CR=1 FL=1